MGLPTHHPRSAVAQDLLPTFFGSLEVFRLAVTGPAFDRLIVLVAGWVLSTGRHSVTEALLAVGVAGQRHHEGYHRFFSRGTWCPDSLGLWLFREVETLLVFFGLPI